MNQYVKLRQWCGKGIRGPLSVRRDSGVEEWMYCAILSDKHFSTDFRSGRCVLSMKNCSMLLIFSMFHTPQSEIIFCLLKGESKCEELGYSCLSDLRVRAGVRTCGSTRDELNLQQSSAQMVVSKNKGNPALSSGLT